MGATMGSACSADRANELPSASLRAAFPDHAPRVLENDIRVMPNDRGIMLRANSSARGFAHIDLTLPRLAQENIRMQVPGGIDIVVRELDVEGSAEIEEHAVIYRRNGGTSFWTVLPSGAEEWLMLEPGAMRRDEPAARWVVEGVRLKQAQEGVDLIDEAGRARMRVSAPEAYAASGKKVAVRLAANAGTIELYVDPVGERVLVDPVWIPVMDPMDAERRHHSAVLLANGDVLVTGGHPPNNPTPLHTAELFKAALSTWEPTPMPMNGTRHSHTATRLTINANNKDKVLIVGGYGNVSGTAEIYNPGTNSFGFTTGAMANARWLHTATEMLNGKVLVVGGTNQSGPVKSVELYNPDTEQWSPMPALQGARTAHTAVLLDHPTKCAMGGCVVIIGGDDGIGVVDTVAIFNESTAALDWTTYPGTLLPTKPSQRKEHTATRLQDGRILVTGGFDGIMTRQTATVYDPIMNTWSAQFPMSTPRQGHTATMLSSGMILLAGGANQGVVLNAAEEYDMVSGSMPILMNVPRVWHSATRLQNGKVLAAGGQESGGLPRSEIYDDAINGDACVVPSDCNSGFCVDGVCCDTACNGDCNACSVAAGAPVNGVCSPIPDGAACSSGNACIVNPTCQMGACTGTPKTCPITNQCLASGTCNPANGLCEYATKADGTLCDDMNACTLNDKCDMGNCKPGDPMVCVASDQCHLAGTCDPAIGVCSNPAKPNKTVCNDGDACTLNDKCFFGACIGTPKQCTALSQCYNAGICNQATGVCSNPMKPNETPCNDGNVCTLGEKCQNGSCGSGTQKTCPPPDQCHNAGTCIAPSGTCSYPNKANGTSCNDSNVCSLWDQCLSGVCQGTLKECYDGTDNNNNSSIDEGTCQTLRTGVEPGDNLEVLSNLGKGWVVTGIGGVVDGNNIVGLTVWKQRVNADGTLGDTGKDVIGSGALEAYAKAPPGYLVVGVALGATKSALTRVKIWYRQYYQATRSLSSTVWSAASGGGIANATWKGWDDNGWPPNDKQLRRVLRNVGARVGDNMLRTMEITHCQLSPWP